MTAPPPALVVLAAGLGSRYGGLKQLDPVGPGGATLMDYSVFDARRAGFGTVVFVVRPDMADDFRTMIEQRYGGRIPPRVALQRLDDVPGGPPAGRTRPWGTGQAVLAAADAVRGDFVVVNADDFYGAEAYAAVAAFLRQGAGGTPPAWAVVGYPLRDTVSEVAGVNRALCDTRDGWLTAMEEVRDITARDQGYAGVGATGNLALAGDVLVSLNMWAFTPAVFDLLRGAFQRFLAAAPGPDAEFLLPTAIQEFIQHRQARVRVLDPRSRWFGMTHRGDRERVAGALAALVRAGDYPERLW